GITSYTNDADGRLIAVQNGSGKALSYTLDAVGNRLLLLDCDNGLTSYSWDTQNRLTGIVNPYNETTTISWDALNRELHRVLGNGMSVSHGYDAAGRETLVGAWGPAGAALAMFSRTYDSAGNRTSVVELDGTRVTYGYDSSYQLINEQRSGANAYNTSYSYDGPGNRLTKNDSGALTSYSYNAANELTVLQPPTGQPTSSSWDGAGNLAVENTGGSLTSYTWDSENRLTGVANPDATSETHVYSADNMRQKKVTAAGTVIFVRDGQNVLIETDGSGVTQAHYTDFPGMWGGLASQRRGTASSFYGFDSQQSSRVLVSVAGLVTDSYSYKAFGEELAAGSGTTNAMRYVGALGYYRDIVNRIYVRARHLRADLGRWISRDPARATQSRSNRYWYVSNRPVRAFDPTGRVLSQVPDTSMQWNLGPDPTDSGDFYGCTGSFKTQWHIVPHAARRGQSGCERGWLIQKVDFTASECTCDPGGPCGYLDQFPVTYWEAVGENGVTAGTEFEIDIFSFHGGGDETLGGASETGELRFYCNIHNK
ncbi:MAG TPA: RHS repeat-associated core domain-containing protein, partial [Chthonomonadales bacterium]|nr:RHS repeat-associated core domain-containing protein [Chthonomonadales bacterium]